MAKSSVDRVTAKANPLVKAFLQRAEQMLPAYIEAHIDERGAPPDGFSRSRQIGAVSGSISRALVPNGRGHIGRYDVPSSSALTSRIAAFVYGIDTNIIRHAMTHEHGDDRPVTPRMRSFFWAKFYETGFDKWRNMARSRKASFHFPARPFWAPGVADFARKRLPKMQAELLESFVRTFNEG